MWEKNVFQRLLIIAGVLLIAGLILATKDLRGGLDIQGGFALIFEIDKPPDETNPTLAEDMKELLQRRVDPRGVLNTEWSVVGENRIEVRMPLPSAKSAGLKNAFQSARETLFESNVKRSDLEALFSAAEAERPAMIERMARGVAARKQAMEQAIVAHAEFEKAAAAVRAATTDTQPAATQPADATEPRLALRDAEEDLDDAILSVMELNLDPQRFQDAIDMDATSRIRQTTIDEMKAAHPDLAAQIDAVVAAHDVWRAERSTLDGPADLRRLLRGAGEMEFRILAAPSPDNVTRYDQYRKQLHERGPTPDPTATEQWMRIDNPIAFMYLDSAAQLASLDPRNNNLPYIVDKRGDDWYVLAKRTPESVMLVERGAGPKWRLTRANVSRDEAGRRCVTFEFDAIGADRFGKLTGNNIGRQLGIFIDDEAYSAANIGSKITSHGQITGDFSTEKLVYLIQTMQAGSLPGRLKDTPVSERSIGASLGQTNLHKAFRAGVISLIAVLVAMALYYFVAGLVANVALLMNMVLVLAIMAMLEAPFTLAGIAGLILTIGMTVDANVLIFERMREEKERGASLRMVIKNGYDKAFSTIIDANITTLLICVIIYYVGSQEIKGFGLTLGAGIITSLFTALFVTRTLFALLMRYGLLKDVPMLRLIGVPNIDWYALRKIFLPASLVTILIGMFLLWERGRDALDVEFRGGVNAEIEIKKAFAPDTTDATIRQALQAAGEQIREQGRALAQATVEPVLVGGSQFRVRAPGLSANQLAAFVAEPLEDGAAGRILQRNGVDASTSEDTLLLSVQPNVTAEQLQAAIRALGADSGEDSVVAAGGDLTKANVNAVLDVQGTEEQNRFWNLTTTVKNKRLVQYALMSALGERVQVLPRVNYTLRGDNRVYAITDRSLSVTVPDAPPEARADLIDFIDGAAFYLDELDPPQALDNSPGSLLDRLRNMRLQPDFAGLPYRTTRVFGVTPAGKDAEGRDVYESVIVAVASQRYSPTRNRDLWFSEFAANELELVTATLDNEQTLRKLTQFKGQIASQSQRRALLAIVLSWAMIIGYVWLRFGRPIYGIAGVTALVHDVCIALAFVGISGWLGGSGHPIGSALLINDFKIDMTIVAAFLTIIGYSINDTIVVFDRIREMRGRLGLVTPDIINRSINQTLARTLLTSGTTLLVILVMYIFGGEGIRGFNFCMMVGILTGTYSSIAVAAPLLMAGAKIEQRQQARAAAAAPATQ